MQLATTTNIENQPGPSAGTRESKNNTDLISAPTVSKRGRRWPGKGRKLAWNTFQYATDSSRQQVDRGLSHHNYAQPPVKKSRKNITSGKKKIRVLTQTVIPTPESVSVQTQTAVSKITSTHSTERSVKKILAKNSENRESIRNVGLYPYDLQTTPLQDILNSMRNDLIVLRSSNTINCSIQDDLVPAIGLTVDNLLARPI